MNFFLSPRIERLITLAIEEDELGFDITSRVFYDDAQANAYLLAKQDFILAGQALVTAVYKRVDERVKCRFDAKDGEAISKGQIFASIEGPAVSVLRGERIALNFLQRMSGVATLTAQFVDTLNDPMTRIVDTRKTLPGWRELDKYSVRCGGGFNHRFNLASGVMIKDNHIAVAGGIAKAVELVASQASHAVRIEVETTSLEEVQHALDAHAEIIMLDNMTTATMRQAVAMIRQHPYGERVIIEASGNMTLDRLSELRGMGLDIISVGALTHSAKAVDISMKLGA